MDYPNTVEKRKAGMAFFRAKMLVAHQRMAKDKTLTANERTYQKTLVATIRKAQQKYGK